MSVTSRRSEEFRKHLGEALRDSFSQIPESALEELLTQAIDTARLAWPGLDVIEAHYLAYLAERTPSRSEPAQALAGLALGDLYVACACARGDSRALVMLESRYFREIDHALGRLRATPSEIDDVKQRVRQQLFTGAPPGIVNYAGTGQLRRWIRVVAMRAHHRLRGTDRKEVAVENELIEALPDGGADPELLHIKQHYREAFRDAFAAAMQALPSEERVLLRQHFIDGLNIDELAALHHVHRATAARWLAQARERIASQTRKLLLQKLKGQQADFDSILRLVQSQLDLSIRGHLRDPTAS